ncbi:MAG: hypothetical protein GTO46_14710 [Gemmatimonadetes bacterium]|nr:hypothetical protein [Gemmatimonadota bacterium]NIO32838.1 hypothetical protein [Gemmatimonadota bacterium]
MSRITRTSTLLLSAGVLLAGSACQPEEGRQQDMSMAMAAPNVVTIVATDFAYQVPAEIPAGLTTLAVVNQGSEPHHAQLIKLGEGKGLADLLEVGEGGPQPSWVSFLGGPNAADPGATTTATSILGPGHYAIVCWIPSPDGELHIAKGMAAEFDVTGSLLENTVEPTADIVMTLVDYGFQLSQPLTAGPQTIRVENAGGQGHEVVVVKLMPGKTPEDFVAWVEKMEGPPPGSLRGGVVDLDPGTHAFFDLEVEPGNYALICFLPDMADGQPHFVHGMMKLVRVT